MGKTNNDGTFREFDLNDWNDFAGCNTNNPTIARFEWGAVVVDGTEVQAHVVKVDDDGDEDYEAWSGVFRSAEAAKLIADAVVRAVDESGLDKLADYLERIA